MTKIINMQAQLDKPLDMVLGCEDYLNLIQDLEFIEKAISRSSLDSVFMQHFLDRASNNTEKELTHKQIIKAQCRGLFILRSSILRKHLKLALRPYTVALAATPLYQQFCGINRWLGSKAPSKSEINSLENALNEGLLSEINTLLNVKVIFNEESCIGLGFKKGFKIEDIFADTTCIKSNIHYPVDWVLFRDMIRTSMLKVQMIRDSGIKNRMDKEPSTYLSGINSLCMEMHAAYNYEGASKERKRVFRKMKKYLKKALKHAETHLNIFKEQWSNFDFSYTKANEIIECLENILEKRDDVIAIAHKRIISEKFVKREDKILSIYEDEVHIIKRSKHDVKSEFGNTVQILEQQNGFLIDYDLLECYTPGDQQLAIQALTKISKNYGLEGIKSFTADRGYDSKAVKLAIEKLNKENGSSIENTITPKDVSKLKEKMKDIDFKNKQKRRAATEAKVAHIKEITQNPMKQKGIRNRKIHMGIAVLTHNLFKLARMNRIALKEVEQQVHQKAS